MPLILYNIKDYKLRMLCRLNSKHNYFLFLFCLVHNSGSFFPFILFPPYAKSYPDSVCTLIIDRLSTSLPTTSSIIIYIANRQQMTRFHILFATMFYFMDLALQWDRSSCPERCYHHLDKRCAQQHLLIVRSPFR